MPCWTQLRASLLFLYPAVMLTSRLLFAVDVSWKSLGWNARVVPEPEEAKSKQPQGGRVHETLLLV